MPSDLKRAASSATSNEVSHQLVGTRHCVLTRCYRVQVQPGQGDELKNESSEDTGYESERMRAQNVRLPFLAEVPNEVLQIRVGEALPCPVEARAKVVHEPPIDAIVSSTDGIPEVLSRSPTCWDTSPEFYERSSALARGLGALSPAKSCPRKARMQARV